VSWREKGVRLDGTNNFVSLSMIGVIIYEQNKTMFLVDYLKMYMHYDYTIECNINLIVILIF